MTVLSIIILSRPPAILARAKRSAALSSKVKISCKWTVPRSGSGWFGLGAAKDKDGNGELERDDASGCGVIDSDGGA
jgi:hypothetical protein